MPRSASILRIEAEEKRAACTLTSTSAASKDATMAGAAWEFWVGKKRRLAVKKDLQFQRVLSKRSLPHQFNRNLTEHPANDLRKSGRASPSTRIRLEHRRHLIHQLRKNRRRRPTINCGRNTPNRSPKTITQTHSRICSTTTQTQWTKRIESVPSSRNTRSHQTKHLKREVESEETEVSALRGATSKCLRMLKPTCSKPWLIKDWIRRRAESWSSVALRRKIIFKNPIIM